MKLLILRPEPGAGRTAARAAAMGLEPVVAPLFRIEPLAWDAPDPAGFDAVLLTSANAASQAGAALGRFTHLPCFAVGGITAEAARAAGFADVRAGSSDGAALLERMAAEGFASAFHPCGRDHIPLDHPAVRLDQRPVYAAEALPELPAAAAQTLEQGALALLHSPRAARQLALLAGGGRERIAIAAISKAAAAAAGPGWKSVATAAAPNDEALLALAAGLCKADAERYGSGR